MTYQNAGTRISAIALFAFALTAFCFGPSPAFAQNVVSEVHYQKHFILPCSGIICQVTIPTIPAKRRLIIEHVTCQLIGGPSGAMIPGNIEVKNANDVLLFRKLITPVFKNSDNDLNIGYYSYDQKADIYIATNQHAIVAVAHTDGGITSAACDLTGRLQTLQ